MADDKPQKIHWSLDVAEAERAEEVKDRESFRIDIGGHTIEMVDARDIDWKILLEIEHPVQFLKYAIKPEDQAYLRRADISGAVFNSLIEAYMRHYGLESRGNGNASRLF